MAFGAVRYIEFRARSARLRRSEGGDFYTQYSCCCSAESKTYYFTRGACRTPFAVSLNTPKAAGEELVRFSMGAPVPVNKLNF